MATEEELKFRASLEDDASRGLRGLGQQAEKTADTVQGAGRKTARAYDPVQAQIAKTENATKRFADSATKSLKMVAGAAAGLFALDKVTTFIQDSISAASDLQQTMQTAGVIFGAQMTQMRAWAETSATSLGLSRQAALDAATGFGGMFTQLGFAGDRAADMSRNVVQLAADLGAFRNVPTADVVDRISAAMRGEYDSLQLLIPNISAARVEHKALEQTGKASAAALTAAEKATATLAVIQHDGANAAGMYAESAAQLAIKQQTANARLEDAQAKIGKELLPAMTDLTQFASTTLIPVLVDVAGGIFAVVDVIGDLPSPVKAAVAALAGLAIARRIGLLSRLRGMVVGVGSAFRVSAARVGTFGGQVRALQTRYGLGRVTSMLSVGASRARGFGRSLLGAFGGPAGLAITGAIAAVTWGLSKLSEAQENAKLKAQEHAAAVNALSDALQQSGRVDSEAVRRSALSNLESATFDGGKDIRQLVDAAGGRFTVTDLVDAQLGDAAAQAKIKAGLAAARAGLMADVPEVTMPNRADYQSDRGYAMAVGLARKDAVVAASNVQSSDEWKRLTSMGQAAVGLFDQQVPAMVDALRSFAAAEGIERQFERSDLQNLVDSGKAQDLNDAFHQLAETIGIGEEQLDDMGVTGQEAMRKIDGATRGAMQSMSQLEKQQLADWMLGFDNPVVATFAAIGDAASTAAEQTDAFRTALDRALGRTPDSQQIKANYFGQVDALKDLFKAGTSDTSGRIESLIGAGGRIRVRTGAGRDFASGAQEFMAALDARIVDAFNTAGGAAGGQQAIKAAMDTYAAGVNDWMAAAAKVAMDPDKAKAVLNERFGKGGVGVPSILEHVGVAQLQQAIGQAATAAGDDVQAQLKAGVGAAVAWMERHGAVELPAGLDTSAAHATLARFKQLVRQRVEMNIDANVYTRVHAGPSAFDLSGQSYAAATAAEAAGHVVAAADGLVRQPQIAAGGSNILWAEPETGWEAYIPGAWDKRARSEQLMTEVAARFGGAYLPAAQVRPMADGGITGDSTAAGGVTIGDIHIDARGATDPREVGRVVRREMTAIMRDDLERSL